jgi:hypothetical protein
VGMRKRDGVLVLFGKVVLFLNHGVKENGRFLLTMGLLYCDDGESGVCNYISSIPQGTIFV